MFTSQSKSEEEQEDEILAELQRKQAELRAVVRVHSNKCLINAPSVEGPSLPQSEYNREQREVLVAMARTEMRRQELRQQLEQV